MKTKFSKALIVILLIVSPLIISGCSSQEGHLFNATWELEFISVPRIAFKGLYPKNKPVITFNQKTNKVEGTNSCNGYSADFKVAEAKISFGEPSPTTMQFCGQGERVFLNMIKKVNAYHIDDEHKLNLKIDDVIMMRFKSIKP